MSRTKKAESLPSAASPAPITPPPPPPIIRVSIQQMDDGYTVAAHDKFTQRRFTAHSTLAGALAELTRAISPPGKAPKPTA